MLCLRKLAEVVLIARGRYNDGVDDDVDDIGASNTNIIFLPGIDGILAGHWVGVPLSVGSVLRMKPV